MAIDKSALATLATVALLAAAPAPATVVGVASVVDGDTIEITCASACSGSTRQRAGSCAAMALRA